jgi:hypothetical protein
MRNTRTAIRCALSASAVGALLAGGCASPPPRQIQGAFLGNQGGSWEAMLPPDGAALADAGTETWRRDSALNLTEAGSILETDLWPEPYRPSLDQTRRVFISSCPGTVTYFGRYDYYYRPFYGSARPYIWP